MPKAAGTSSPTSSPSFTSKNRIRTVLGLGATEGYTSDNDLSTHPRNSTFGRKSIDAAFAFGFHRKDKSAFSSLANLSASQSNLQPTVTNDSTLPSIDTSSLANMTIENNRRAVVRADTEGPWSVSVAESPYNPQSYSLYIKTPTHNLTLTRTLKEISDFDKKLRESYAGNDLPPFPIDLKSLPPIPPKRKSAFLNTLSRLTSPTSSKSGKSSSSFRRTINTTSLPSDTPPVTSPSSATDDDPFSPTMLEAEEIKPSAQSTALAAYLTTLSNLAGVRNNRVWKRFVRVRTDDLESVRVERAIKRVRSDLAAHGGTQSIDKDISPSISDKPVPETPSTTTEDSENVAKDQEIVETKVNGNEVHKVQDEPAEEKEKEIGEVAERSQKQEVDLEKPEIDSSDAATDLETPVTSSIGETTLADEPPTPVASEGPASASRIPRSQSVDFDQPRMARAHAESTPSRDGHSSSMTDVTGDESSASTTGGGRRTKRKKRSKSTVPKEPRKSQRKVAIDDFEMMRVLGKGCAGKVLLVRHKATQDLYALKAITKRHVLAHQELQHTLTEQAVLKRMAADNRDPFVVKLWWSFHDKENLFLVMDFHPGGDLATQLARWGRLGRDRARFYAAEIVEGCEGLHAAGVIYRDLKPENILIGADGHIVLTDFGLSKEFSRKSIHQTAPSTPSGTRNGADFYSSVPGTTQPTVPPWMKVDTNGELAFGWPGPLSRDTTHTFCGTAEYLAPEVIQGLPYSYEVDWWSFGTMLYEMLTGITPFWANNHSDMYVRVLQDELQFPEDRAMDQDTKSLIRGLLQRNPALRMCEPRIKKHPYFSMIDWSHVYYKRYIPPYIPPIDPQNASDTQNFDDTFLDMAPVLDEYVEEQTDTDQEPADQTDTDRTDGEESNTTPSQSRSSSIAPLQRTPPGEEEGESVDVFDGYSFKGRHSVLIDDEEEDGSDGSSEPEEEEEEEEALRRLSSIDTNPPTEPAAPAAPAPAPVPAAEEEEVDAELPEPKTPEARPASLPAEEEEPKTPLEAPAVPPVPPVVPPKDEADVTAPSPIEAPVEPTLEVQPRTSKDLPPPGSPEAIPPTLPEKDAKSKATGTVKAPPARSGPSRGTHKRKERSGVAALDRYLSDTVDEDTEAVTEREDDEDDDWDFIEAEDGEDRNGTKGTSLFARGVVDRYRLAVFKKSIPSSQRNGARSVSAMSKASESGVSDAAESPTSKKDKRGRSAGLNFRKNPRQFLRPKSPPPPPPSSFASSSILGTPQSSITNRISTATSSNGFLTPNKSFGTVSHSLRSRESTASVSAQSLSDTSGQGESTTNASEHTFRTPTTPSRHAEDGDKPKTKKLKRYKENAERVFSIFSSPRQP